MLGVGTHPFPVNVHEWEYEQTDDATQHFNTKKSLPCYYICISLVIASYYTILKALLC